MEDVGAENRTPPYGWQAATAVCAGVGAGVGTGVGTGVDVGSTRDVIREDESRLHVTRIGSKVDAD